MDPSGRDPAPRGAERPTMLPMVLTAGVPLGGECAPPARGRPRSRSRAPTGAGTPSHALGGGDGCPRRVYGSSRSCPATTASWSSAMSRVWGSRARSSHPRRQRAGSRRTRCRWTSGDYLEPGMPLDSACRGDGVRVEAPTRARCRGCAAATCVTRRVFCCGCRSLRQPQRSRSRGSVPSDSGPAGESHAPRDSSIECRRQSLSAQRDGVR